MKPTEHKISDASFTGHYFKLLVIRLKQFKNAKHVVLVVIVLVCTLERYVVLSQEKNPAKLQSVTRKNQKVKNQTPKFIFNNAVWQQRDVLQFEQNNVNSAKTDGQYFFVNEVQ
ncbi:MAG: hypothetical protein EOP42_03875 [Sphingobacteriaceae bacterium]|nr:MAG: hypothetical protein EOP42_03875 [Sphingobacteriaceae bacterium]